MARREDHFFLKCPKPSDFVKLGSEILFCFWQKKWSFVVCFVCLLVATLFDFGLLFFD